MDPRFYITTTHVSYILLLNHSGEVIPLAGGEKVPTSYSRILQVECCLSCEIEHLADVLQGGGSTGEGRVSNRN